MEYDLITYKATYQNGAIEFVDATDDFAGIAKAEIWKETHGPLCEVYALTHMGEEIQVYPYDEN